MSSFLAQCPHCSMSFRVSDSQLEAAGGMVRCGACLGIFSAPANRITLKSDTPPEASQGTLSLLEEAPEEVPPAGTALPEDAVEPDELDIPLGDMDLDFMDDEDEDTEEDWEEAEDDLDEEKDVEEDVEDAWDEEEDVEEDVEDAWDEAGGKEGLRRNLAALEDEDALVPLPEQALDGIAPEPLQLGMAGGSRSRLLPLMLFGFNLLLFGLLGLQYLDANIERLMSSRRLAPYLPQLCRILACPVVQSSDLDSLVSEQLLVRSHPRFAQALEVSFIFRNEAATAQPFPAIELGFSDVNRRLIANRLFRPAEYLPPELRSLREMPARSSVQITLELADPGSEAVNYNLAFREP